MRNSSHALQDFAAVAATLTCTCPAAGGAGAGAAEGSVLDINRAAVAGEAAAASVSALTARACSKTFEQLLLKIAGLMNLLLLHLLPKGSCSAKEAAVSSVNEAASSCASNLRPANVLEELLQNVAAADTAISYSSWSLPCSCW